MLLCVVGLQWYVGSVLVCGRVVFVGDVGVVLCLGGFVVGVVWILGLVEIGFVGVLWYYFDVVFYWIGDLVQVVVYVFGVDYFVVVCIVGLGQVGDGLV